MPVIFQKPTLETHLEKFSRSVKRNDLTGCLEWAAGFTSTGYGQFAWGHVNDGPMTTTAHRAAWWLFKGDVPEGMVLCHKCNNRKCVEVNMEGHVYPGSQRQNMLDRNESGYVPLPYKNFLWRGSPGLAEKILTELRLDKTVEEVCSTLDIGRTTFYRVRDEYPEIQTLIRANKISHMQRGARHGKNAKLNSETFELAKKEISLGGNVHQISRRIGITPLTLRRWCDREEELAFLLARRPKHASRPS